jgi:predicted cobalt transporter CbtA
MSLCQKYLRILSGILPAGAVGVSVFLGSTTTSLAKEHSESSQSAAAATVAERLSAIREAVSAVVEQGESAKPADGFR